MKRLYKDSEYLTNLLKIQFSYKNVKGLNFLRIKYILRVSGFAEDTFFYRNRKGMD